MKIARIYDFDGNGIADILWYRASTKANFVTLMNGAVRGTFKYLGGNGDPDLELVSLGDFDGNGQVDLLWRRISSGFRYVTLMNNQVPGPYKYIGAGPVQWFLAP